MNRRYQLLALASFATACILTPSAHAGAPSAPATETGAISRATGHAFRAGLTAGFAADGAARPALQANDNGLITKPEEGALPKDLWADQSGKALGPLLDPLRPNPTWPSTLSLTRRLLLTDAPWPEGPRLQAVRLEKMILFAAAPEAAHLYAHLGIDTPDANLVKQGMRALLASGTPNLACVERLTHMNVTDDKDPFWLDTKALCAALITNEVGGKGPAQTLGTYPSLADLSPRVDSPSLATRLKHYTESPELTPPTPGMDTPAIASPSDAPEWAQLAHVYRQARALGPAAPKLELIKEISNLSVHLPLRAHLLFAQTLERANPALTNDPHTIARVTSLLLAADSPAASAWFTKFQTHLGPKPAHNPPATALMIMAQMRGLKMEKSLFPLSFTQLVTDKKTQLGKLTKNLSEMLDTAPVFIDTPSDVYEKGADSPPGTAYVVPWSELQDHLTQAREDQRLGEGIVASLLILQGKDPLTIDPDVLLQVLKTLTALNLQEEARQIATTVLYAIYIEGEQEYGSPRSPSTTQTQPTPVH